MRARWWALALVAIVTLVAGLSVTRRAPSAQHEPAVVTMTKPPRRERESSPVARGPSVPSRPGTEPRLELPARSYSIERPVERDPRKPGYDAARVVELNERSPTDLFAAEPRVEPWATEREGDIISLALPEFRDVDHDARIEVDCHTGICRVRVHSSRPGVLTDRLDNYPLTCLASWASQDPGPRGPGVEDPFSDFYMIFGSETRDREDFLARRDDTCARYRDEWRRRVLLP